MMFKEIQMLYGKHSSERSVKFVTRSPDKESMADNPQERLRPEIVFSLFC